MNSLQRAQRRKLRLVDNCETQGDGECVSELPCLHSPQCTLCGEPLDGHQWCDHSTNGFHVKPLANL